MSVVLLLLGVVTTVAGLVLVASGVTIRDGTFDAEVVTPGTIAAIGGLVLIGMGLAVRELKRIERALASRPMPRAARLGEALAGAAAAEAPDASVQIPLPKGDAQSVSSDPHTAASATEDATFEHSRVQFPILPRAEEAVVEAKIAAAAGRGGGNGAAPVRLAPRLDVKGRPAAASDVARTSGLDAFWPKGRQDGQGTAQAAAVPQSRPAAQPATAGEAGLKTESSTAAAPVSVLKSGVVEGMAYTLYSDGSIEAQLPQGTMRFGSITALRNHIERSA